VVKRRVRPRKRRRHNPTSALLRRYATLARQFPVTDESKTYGALVTAETNAKYPVQRWFHFKEAYSIDLLAKLITRWRIPKNAIRRILDPFCGTGTTLLAAQRLAKKWDVDLEAVGIERNPLLHFIAQTKLLWNIFDADGFRSKTAYLLNGARKPTTRKIPDLSTFQRRDILPPTRIRKLIGFRNAINAVDGLEKLPLLLGFASALEDVSGIRKDGRMIRLVKNKQRSATPAALKKVWGEIAEDLKKAPEFFEAVRTKVLLGDGRTLTAERGTDTFREFDLIVYSPPYLNNIDYTEVYKIELWLCGFVKTRADFRALRHLTFRSHPSVRFKTLVTITKRKELKNIKRTLQKLLNAIPGDEDYTWRVRLFTAYFDDIYQSLKHQYRALRPSGWVFCVVGNSLHGSSVTPNKHVPVVLDLLIAFIAAEIGFEVKGIQIARYLKRRGTNSNLLRESIVVLRKPRSPKRR